MDITYVSLEIRECNYAVLLTGGELDRLGTDARRPHVQTVPGSGKHKQLLFKFETENGINTKVTILADLPQ